MKRLWDPVIQSAADLQKVATRLLNEGASVFRSRLGSFSLFSSTDVSQDGENDETHYLLIPDPVEPGRYSLYHHRRLPHGVGPENKLRKKRIFHLASADQQEILTGLLFDELKSDHLEPGEPISPLAERLELIADEIDRQSERVTGGLLWVGGAVAVANPLLGVTIATKGLIPSVGSKLTTHGFKHASAWLRERQKKAADDSAAHEAKMSLKKDQPEIRENQVLKILHQAHFSKDDQFDPVLASVALWDDQSSFADHKIAARAVSDSYQGASIKGPTLKTWIDQLAKIADINSV